MDPEEAFAQSFGRDIWWSQGDVGTTQVKSMLGTVDNAKIASIFSVF
jgi:hypothetical protein